MITVALFDQNDSHFATFDMPLLPHVGDSIEIGFANEQIVKTFTIERVIHQMIQIPPFNDDPPWRWEYRLHGDLYNPKTDDWANQKCICEPNQGAVKCPKHGQQDANRDMCPKCGKHVLGYCAQGEYCTSDECRYVA